MNLPSWAYLTAWLTILAIFVAFEMLAILDVDKGDTFSEFWWRILGAHRLVWFVGAGVLAWLVLHILFKA